MHAIFDESGNLNNMGDTDNSNLKVLLQFQRNSLINDPLTEISSYNRYMYESGDADKELTDGPGMLSKEHKETNFEYDQEMDTIQLDEEGSLDATSSKSQPIGRVSR